MCGILFCLSKDGYNVNKAVKKRYHKQSGRGTQGFGFVTVENGKIKDLVKRCTEREILRELASSPSKAVMFHHRYPTISKNYEEMAHPFHISDPKHKFDYYVIHNGVLNNHDDLYKEYIKDGYIFQSQVEEKTSIVFPNQKSSYEMTSKITVNDSEVFSVDLARYLEGLQRTIRSRGTISFIALKTDKEGTIIELIWGHNDGNPLKLEEDKTIFCLRSEGKGKSDVPVDEINFMNWSTGERIVVKEDVGSYYGSKKAGFKTEPDYSGMPYSARRVASVERYMEPSHPLLPAPISMGASLREIGHALTRQSGGEHDDFQESEKLRKELNKGRDDERESNTAIEFDEPNYSAADDDTATTEGWFFSADTVTHKKLRDAAADLEIEQMVKRGSGKDLNDYEIQLKEYLKGAMTAYEEKEMASKMLHEALRSNDILEVESARVLLLNATNDLKVCINEINNLTAELTAWESY